MLPPEPYPWPFDGDTYRMGMGLRTQDPAQWLAPDAGCPVQLAERARLLRERKWDVLALMPEARAAAAELLELVIAHLTGRFPDWFSAVEGGIDSRVAGMVLKPADFDHPLHLLGHLLPDDLCLLSKTPGGWRLMGGAVCFPSHWFLPHMLGKPLPGIHRRVPGYDASLATPVDRFFDTLAPGRTAWRANWTLADDPTLFQPGTQAHSPPDADIDADNAGDRLYLRVERQTLSKLPGSGAVLFTIRTHLRPLSALDGEQRRQFASVLRSVPEDVASYKGLRRTGAVALGYLEG
ncbi:heme-dependent oxidative N-demethylase family protein [Niveispirillum sp. KHB5.9]|uniref:heme-dependent oxidative N-demethylase family protein n=1 Tax=Niveispirillum sp. KHB5.9 TaxID=3400269 RepID=UPI003A8899F5